MTRSKFMLRLRGNASHRLGGDCQAVHALGAFGRSELDLLNQQSDIDTELTGCFHLAARFRIPQSLDGVSQGIPSQWE